MHNLRHHSFTNTRTVTRDWVSSDMNDISSLLRWAETWQMRFNSKKCHILSISRQRNKSSPVYYLGTDVLSTVNSHTYLGITESSDLKWHEHISNICLKSTRTLNFVRRNTYCCSQEAKNLAYRYLSLGSTVKTATSQNGDTKTSTNQNGAATCLLEVNQNGDKRKWRRSLNTWLRLFPVYLWL